jgi:hypothetical protein
VARLTELSEAMDTTWRLDGDRVTADAACP